MPLSKLMVCMCPCTYHRLLRHYEKHEVVDRENIIQKEIGRGQQNVAAKQQLAGQISIFDKNNIQLLGMSSCMTLVTSYAMLFPQGRLFCSPGWTGSRVRSWKYTFQWSRSRNKWLSHTLHWVMQQDIVGMFRLVLL